MKITMKICGDQPNHDAAQHLDVGVSASRWFVTPVPSPEKPLLVEHESALGVVQQSEILLVSSSSKNMRSSSMERMTWMTSHI